MGAAKAAPILSLLTGIKKGVTMFLSSKKERSAMSQEATKKKKQLMMLLFPVYKPLELPEGCAITHYRGPEDIPVWIELCKNGLASEDAGRDFFDACITNFPCIDPQQDILFLEDNGVKVGTITAVNDWGNGVGRIHMVSVADSCRGKGYSHLLSRAAENKLAACGVKSAALTTDAWRKAACKCYLRSGWYPVNHDTDMPERWGAVLKDLGIDSVQMYTETGEKDIVLYAAK
jgi:GNAT superfamily N-acetyltransferase